MLIEHKNLFTPQQSGSPDQSTDAIKWCGMDGYMQHTNGCKTRPSRSRHACIKMSEHSVRIYDGFSISPYRIVGYASWNNETCLETAISVTEKDTCWRKRPVTRAHCEHLEQLHAGLLRRVKYLAMGPVIMLLSEYDTILVYESCTR